MSSYLYLYTDVACVQVAIHTHNEKTFVYDVNTKKMKTIKLAQTYVRRVIFTVFEVLLVPIPVNC